MYNSDTEFFLTLVLGLLWGYAMKSFVIWTRELEQREQDEREARQRLRRHPSWRDDA